MRLPQVELAIIGGSGINRIKGAKVIRVISKNDLRGPFGLPSNDIYIVEIFGRTVALLLRHSVGHIINPTTVPYRANAYALAMLGVRIVVAVSACGVLKQEIEIGVLTVPNQLVDFTKHRTRTLFNEKGLVIHVSMANPFCNSTRIELIEAVEKAGLPVNDKATYITIEGPQYSTKAESKIFASWNCDIIGMTTSPEAHLMREAGICYVVLAMPTDHDAGLGDMYKPVDGDEVLKTFNANIVKVQLVLPIFIRGCVVINCDCHHAVEKGIHTDSKYIPHDQRKILETLTRKI